ncbi:MAG: ABC transporter ATP-binding protein [Acidobacteriota bacterium]
MPDSKLLPEKKTPDKKWGPPKGPGKRSGPPGLFLLLKPYAGLVVALLILTIAANALNLLVPKLISRAIDSFSQQSFVLSSVMVQFSLVGLFVFLLSYLQSIVQTYASEKVARDLRTKLAGKIATQSYAFVESITPSKLLTNLTSDVDAVKLFVSQAIASIIASIFLIIGASILLVSINWRLGLGILVIIPIIGGTFFFALGKVRKLFKKAQEAIDVLNRVINESILGSALIRLLYSQHIEYNKFIAANGEARDIGLGILRVMAALIPVITLATNLATVVILGLGGHFVILGSMSLGDFTAFNTYLSILVFPIIMLGFMSNVIAQATASFQRLDAILNAEPEPESGTIDAPLRGDLTVENICLSFEDKQVLKDVSFEAKAGQSIAIIGPTAAGKTQLLYLLIGLLKPSSGSVKYDGHPIEAFKKENLHRQVGLVFQDSILFNLTVRENIAFSPDTKSETIQKAIAAAELEEFIASLPDGLDAVVSERGTSLSGGQKQRVMLARALALNPKVLLLDDFTARVDTSTEQAILKNVHEQFPGITLISVTQKIASVENYDQIVLLMEGEVIAKGTHALLMETCPEYVQIYDSQRSTNVYELQA